MKVSIIIPAYNEAQSIQSTLVPLQSLRSNNYELILVDAGSTDDTVASAESLVDKLLHSKKGRAYQMNAGAAEAEGEVLFFLHADTIVPVKAISALETAIDKSNFTWSRFNVRLSGTHILFRVIEKLINLRSCLTGIATGDQGICIKRDLFFNIGMYELLPLMEDIALSKKLKKIARPVCISQALITSSRRWEEKGIFRTILLMWKLRLQFWLGVSADKLAEQYR